MKKTDASPRVQHLGNFSIKDVKQDIHHRSKSKVASERQEEIRQVAKSTTKGERE